MMSMIMNLRSHAGRQVRSFEEASLRDTRKKTWNLIRNLPVIEKDKEPTLSL